MYLLRFDYQKVTVLLKLFFHRNDEINQKIRREM